MSMVELNEVALRFGESLAPTEQESYTLTPIGALKNEWKISVGRGMKNGNGTTSGCSVNVLEIRGGILGSMNVAAHDLVLTKDFRKGKDQMYVGCHSCHQQRTISDHHNFQPV